MEDSRGFLRRNITAFIAVACLLLPLCVVYSQEGWEIRKSFHFYVYHKGCSENFLDRLIDKAEDGYREVTSEFKFFRDEPWLWEKRARVYVFRNKDEYLESTHMPEWSSGSALPLQRTIYTYEGSYTFLEGIIIHEITHLIFREFVGRAHIALWLDEGVAVYMEKKHQARFLKKQMKRLLRQDAYIPFIDFLHVEFKDLDREREHGRQLRGEDYVEKFYIQSFSLVYFLIDEFGTYRLIRMLRRIRDGESFEDAFFNVYTQLKNVDRLERRWKEFYR